MIELIDRGSAQSRFCSLLGFVLQHAHPPLPPLPSTAFHLSPQQPRPLLGSGSDAVDHFPTARLPTAKLPPKRYEARSNLQPPGSIYRYALLSPYDTTLAASLPASPPPPHRRDIGWASLFTHALALVVLVLAWPDADGARPPDHAIHGTASHATVASLVPIEASARPCCPSYAR